MTNDLTNNNYIKKLCEIKSDLAFQNELFKNKDTIFNKNFTPENLKNNEFKKNLMLILNRIIDTIGFEIQDSSQNNILKKIKKIKRKENGHYVGLFSDRFQKTLETVINFVEKNLQRQSLKSLFLNIIFFAIKNDDRFLKQINKSIKINNDGIFQKMLNKIDNINQDIKGLTNLNNSCYQDSVLMALFINDIQIVNNTFFGQKFKNQQVIELQKELEKIKNFIHGQTNLKELTTKNMKSKLKALPPQLTNVEPFTKDGQQDVQEFLNMLFIIFNFPETFEKHRVVTHTLTDNRQVETKNETTAVSCIFTVDKQQLEHYSNYIQYIFAPQYFEMDMNNQPPGSDLRKQFDYQNETVTSKMRYETTELKYKEKDFKDISPFFIIYINRTGAKTKIFTKCEIIEKVNNVKLSSVIRHIGESSTSGHYICYFKKCFRWFLYDDLSDPKIKYIGTFNDLVSQSGIQENCVLLFYAS